MSRSILVFRFPILCMIWSLFHCSLEDVANVRLCFVLCRFDYNSEVLHWLLGHPEVILPMILNVAIMKIEYRL